MMAAVQRTQAPVARDLVLLGGGHAHVAVLKSFGMQPLPGVRVTLISRDPATPYSGMLPGLIAGHYTFDEAHIELRPLCHFAGAQFYQATVTGLDLENKRVFCAGRPPVSFDLLSIDTGSTPKKDDVPGAKEFVLPVKPVDRLLDEWPKLLSSVQQAGSDTFRIAVVGGGAGGVELTLCTQHRLRTLLAESSKGPSPIEFHILTDAPAILPTHNSRVQAKFERILRERGVHVHLNHRVVKVTPGLLHCEHGQSVAFRAALWVTTASAPRWVKDAGLQTDAAGFVAVNDCLQSLSHPFVFAAGDVATTVNHPRPKSGVFAVRQGAPLARNLRQYLAQQALEAFKPQKKFLGLISTGDQYAVASRGAWALEGAWVWKWKDWIDRRWMRRYQDLKFMPAKTSGMSPALPSLTSQDPADLTTPMMRCGGCGTKVGSTVLANVLRRMKPFARPDVLVGLETPDDAAVTVVPSGQLGVQTVDFFRTFLNDPHVFGRIAANHCLGDIFAMGAEPQSALAIVTVPYGNEAAMGEQLFQVLSGAAEVLEEHQTTLAGGHTTEGPELAFGLSVQGIADPNQLLRKAGMKPGDQLVLTKPLGTGTLFAADMRGRAKGAWIDSALQSMLISNREAARCVQRHHATACTDVTGFGLLGHLLEMVKASNVAVELFLHSVPVLGGVDETLRAGILSSLQPQNLRLRRALANGEEAVKHERYPILFDPQTAGGLLAAVPQAQVEHCLLELHGLGYRAAAIIGSVREPFPDSEPILIVF